MIETVAVPDAQAMLLLCSTLGLARDGRPLTAGEWKAVATALERAALRPADLLGFSADETTRVLGIPMALASRMAALLARGGQLALELDRLHARGIWVRTRVDDDYPNRLRERLKAQAPIVLCGAGPLPSGDGPAMAIVGSRDVDERGLAFTRQLGAACAAAGVAVVSGGARGVDMTAQEAALDAGGVVHAVLADSLEKALQKRALRDAVRRGHLTLMTTVHPSAPFSAGIAMGRNKVVYALSTSAVVVSSAEASGGTWAGATENLERGWVPLFVRSGDDVPGGNLALLASGAHPVEDSEPDILRLVSDVASHAVATPYEDVGARSEQAVIVAEPAPPPYPAESSPGPFDVYTVIVEPLRMFCDSPRTATEIQEAFHLQPGQAKVWLARAQQEGVLTKVKRTRYQAAPRSLFDA